ncbi:hypothetical protein ACWDSJ_29320 [Nocardia sp. NPDC003482]
MTTTDQHRHEDQFAEFAEEMRLLAEAVLERVEPVLRAASAEGRTEWDSCSWCPVCAVAALVRGEHHDVVAALAEHGTAVVTVLREALAGVPVEPMMPEPPEPQGDSRGDSDSPGRAAAAEAFADEASAVDAGTPGEGAAGRRPSFGATLLAAFAGRAQAAARGNDSPTGESEPRTEGRSGYVPIPVQIKR